MDLSILQTASLALPYQPPLAWAALTDFLISRGARRVEALKRQIYTRCIKIKDTRGWFSARVDHATCAIRVEVAPSLTDHLDQLGYGLRRLFDLDANPATIDQHLAQDVRLRDLVQATPGLRVPGTLDGFELALRAILGQQVSVSAATTLFNRLVERFGCVIATPFDPLDHCMPTAHDLADAGLAQLRAIGLTRRRAETVKYLAREVAAGCIDLTGQADPAQVRTALLAVPGIGPWTADYVGMRAFGDGNAWPQQDLGLLRALRLTDPHQFQAVAVGWQPWRAYAALHLWQQHGRGG